MDSVVGLLDITVADSQFVAVGFDPGDDYRQDGVVFVSENGVDWTRLAVDHPALTTGTALVYGIAEGGPGLVAGGLSCEDNEFPCLAGPYPTVWTSTDGTAWTRIPVEQGESIGPVLDVLVTDHGIVATGAVTEPTQDGGTSSSPTVWLSGDGISWSRVWQGAAVRDAEFGSGPAAVVLALDPDGLIVGAGSAYNESGEGVAAVWVSSNAVDWIRVDPESVEFASDAGHGAFMSDIVWGPTGFVAVGGDGSRAAVWTSTDGVTWARTDTGRAPIESAWPLTAIAALDGGYVAAGPDGHAEVLTLWTSTDGISWDRVQVLGEGNADAIVSTEVGIAVAGQLPSDDDYHAAVWMGPMFDPAQPPSDPVPTSQEEPAVVAPSGGSPLPDVAGAVGGDDGSDPLPLGSIMTLPESVQVDFLIDSCRDSCFRDGVFLDPDNPGFGSGIFISDAPFHVRHGFINNSEEPLGEGYNVVVYVTELDEAGDLGGQNIGETYRYTSDYVLRGTSDKCGPTYGSKSSPETCEWFVHEFNNGLPEGRHALWAVWEAPCSAWVDYGLTEACTDPDEVVSLFSSGFDLPFDRFPPNYTQLDEAP
jgi:hypothetical protein